MTYKSNFVYDRSCPNFMQNTDWHILQFLEKQSGKLQAQRQGVIIESMHQISMKGNVAKKLIDNRFTFNGKKGELCSLNTPSHMLQQRSDKDCSR